MTDELFSLDEAILVTLADQGIYRVAELAAALTTGDRTVRRRLRRLIHGGYVFSPVYGRYRITAAGIAVLTPVGENARLIEMRRAHLLASWQQKR